MKKLLLLAILGCLGMSALAVASDVNDRVVRAALVMKQISEQFKSVTHVIESGDYLTQLANLYKTTASAILKANNFSDPSDLSIGERIVIPVLP